MLHVVHHQGQPALEIFPPDLSGSLDLPFVNQGISAGFPSPADDFLDIKIDLNREFIKNPNSTFYARVRGRSMVGAGLSDGDLLIIDRSLEPENKKIAVCFVDGEFTVKRIKKEKDTVWLLPENEEYQPIKVTADNEFIIWGIVTTVIKNVE
jgi:DNA polymerase V